MYKLPDAASMARPCALLNETPPSAATEPDDEMVAMGALSPRTAYTTKLAPPVNIWTAINWGWNTPLASVVTACERVSIARMRLLAVSATKSESPPTTTLLGYQKVAAVPTPLAEPVLVPPAMPPPASVVTARAESDTTRIRLFEASAT
jgi:hypothetical protein